MRLPVCRLHLQAKIANGDLGSNVRAQPQLLRRRVETWRSVEAVAVEDAESWHAKIGCLLD